MGEGPDRDLEHLEGIQHGHRNGVSPLVSKVAPNACTEPFVGLSDVDRLAVVVEECIDTPTKVPDRHRRAAGPIEWRVKKSG